MSKLTLDALREKAGNTATTELLATISGGTENSCHDDYSPCDQIHQDMDSPRPAGSPLLHALLRWWHDC